MWTFFFLFLSISQTSSDLPFLGVGVEVMLCWEAHHPFFRQIIHEICILFIYWVISKRKKNYIRFIILRINIIPWVVRTIKPIHSFVFFTTSTIQSIHSRDFYSCTICKKDIVFTTLRKLILSNTFRSEKALL